MAWPAQVTGRCYCGAVSFTASALQEVTYCHCSDCRRATGAPVAAFAAFREDNITFTGKLKSISVSDGVTRKFCEACGSPVSGHYSYLAGTIYVSVGLCDQIAELEPRLHAHHDNTVKWLHLSDDLERHSASARKVLP